MTTVQVCRTCLSYDTRMYTITNTPVQQYYEDITKITLNTQDGIPSAVCYICYHLLQKCHRFTESAVRAYEVLQQLCKSGIQIAAQDMAMLDKGLMLTFCQTPVTCINTSVVSENIEIPNVKYENFEIKTENDQDNIAVTSEFSEPYLEMEVPTFFEIKKEKIEIEDADPPYCSSGSDDDVLLPMCKLRKKTTSCRSEHERERECGAIRKGVPGKSGRRIKGAPATKIRVKKNTKSPETQAQLLKEELRNYSNHAVVPNSEKKQSSIIHNKNEIVKNLNPEAIDDKQCNYCGKKFQYKSLLTRHLRMHTGEKPFPCNYCDKRFTLSDGLTQHVKRMHTGEKPYICNVCGKDFLQKSLLTKHLPVHTGEKPFTCNYCGKSYSLKLKLKHHIRMHTGERPFPCNLCELRFTEKYLLTRHLRRHL